MRFAQAMGWLEVVLEGDSAQVVAAIQSRTRDQLPFGFLISEVLCLIPLFHGFQCSFVRRSGNMLAHVLAHLALGDLGTL